VLSRGTFSGAIFLVDIALIAAMSCLTGIAYHLVVYGNRASIASFVRVGLLAASIFAISTFRREYRLPNSSASSRMRGARSNCGTRRSFAC
jgi:O-antigen ligase